MEYEIRQVCENVTKKIFKACYERFYNQIEMLILTKSITNLTIFLFNCYREKENKIKFKYKYKYKYKYVLPACYSLSFKYIIDYDIPEFFLQFISKLFNFSKDYTKIEKAEVIILNVISFKPFFEFEKIENKYYKSRERVIKSLKNYDKRKLYKKRKLTFFSLFSFTKILRQI